jgi:hypothetical protein
MWSNFLESSRNSSSLNFCDFFIHFLVFNAIEIGFAALQRTWRAEIEVVHLEDQRLARKGAADAECLVGTSLETLRIDVLQL